MYEYGAIKTNVAVIIVRNFLSLPSICPERTYWLSFTLVMPDCLGILDVLVELSFSCVEVAGVHTGQLASALRRLTGGVRSIPHEQWRQKDDELDELDVSRSPSLCNV